jgi:hypothetical protein
VNSSCGLRFGRGRAKVRPRAHPARTGWIELEHVPEKLLDFFDYGMLQLFDFELRSYRSNDFI